MKINAVYILVFIVFLFPVISNGEACQSTKDLPNFGCVNTHLYRGGQPTEQGIKELSRQHGIKMIIDLRENNNKTLLEESWARNSGIKYINLPLSNWSAPTDVKIKEILDLLFQAENQPVFVHCERGADRTGTVMAIYRIKHDGWTAKQAMTEAKNFKLGWWQFWMKKYINNYYKNHGKNPSIVINFDEQTDVSQNSSSA